MCVDPLSIVLLPRISLGYEEDDVCSASGETREDTELLSRRHELRVGFSMVTLCSPGPYGIGSSSSSSGQGKVQGNSRYDTQALEGVFDEPKEDERKACCSQPMGQDRHRLVDESRHHKLLSVVKVCSGVAINQTSLGCDGNSCGLNSSRRDHVQGVGATLDSALNCPQGMVGIRMDDSASSSQIGKQSHHMACRQYERKAGMVEQWHLSGQVALQEGDRNADNSSCTEHKGCSSLCAICTTSARRSDKSEEGSSRLAPAQASSSERVSSLWAPRSRSYGYSEFHTSSNFHLSHSGRESCSDRRIHRRLEPVQSSLCFPSTSNNGVGIEQDFSMQQEYNIHCDKPVVQGSSVVSESIVSVNVSSHQTTSLQEDCDGFGDSEYSSREQIRRNDKVRRLEAYRRGRPEIGRLSDGAVQTLLKSWAEGTEESYGLGYRYYASYCKRNNLEEFTADPTTLINFLQEEFETTNKQHSTLNSYRSAVSMTLPPCANSNLPVGQHPLVCRFLKGVHRLRPPKVKLFPTWQVSDVLQYLLSWGDLKNLPLNKLLIKTAFLVALVCFKRPADLINMCVKEGFWSLSMEGFRCQPLGYGKTERHHPVPPLVIEPFSENSCLCPVLHLVSLEEKLATLRKNEERFWISAKKPYKAISSKTMCNWLKKVIVDSGAAGTARDVRSNGSSTAAQANLDLSRILQAGNWNRVSTFQRHYFRPQKIPALSSILKVSSSR